jgi:mRNA interferase MazF
MSGLAPARGEIWLAVLDPTRGHEQAGRRPCLVVSVDPFNQGPAELVVVLPLTTRDRGILWHVRVDPPEGGLRARSFVKCEDVRSISKERLGSRYGLVMPVTMREIEDRLRLLFGL